jgi:hypothetical protein
LNIQARRVRKYVGIVVRGERPLRMGVPPTSVWRVAMRGKLAVTELIALISGVDEIADEVGARADAPLFDNGSDLFHRAIEGTPQFRGPRLARLDVGSAWNATRSPCGVGPYSPWHLARHRLRDAPRSPACRRTRGRCHKTENPVFLNERRPDRSSHSKPRPAPVAACLSVAGAQPTTLPP